MGTVIYFIFAATILLGIQEKEGFAGCGYTPTSVDHNPAEHFFDIPKPCRVSHFMGVQTALLAIFIAFLNRPKSD